MHISETIEQDVFQNDLEYWLTVFCEQYNITDLKAETQNVFHASMTYIYNNYIKGKGNIFNSIPYNRPNNTNLVTNYNSYNVSKDGLLYYIYNWYCFTCDRLDKIKTISGFCLLTGIEQSTIYNWLSGGNGSAVSLERLDFAKNLRANEEESLSSTQISGKRNPMSIMPTLNRKYGWSSPYTAKEKTQDRALIASELPKLSAQNSHNLQVVQSDEQTNV